jgi:hypothetical protein
MGTQLENLHELWIEIITERTAVSFADSVKVLVSSLTLGSHKPGFW